ncbi:hypothetical protein V6N13_027813 [Hibiscus sabdariffa]|uniref:Uncharacterized protein n=1 Tax=Hibiscus sabdariffa TaxID=183260 RepID=A0ABR2CFP9_9ROSI
MVPGFEREYRIPELICVWDWGISVPISSDDSQQQCTEAANNVMHLFKPRLPPLSTEPNRCERAFVGNKIGQTNGVYDKPLDLRFCDYTNEKSNLKGKSLSASLMADAMFDGADMTEAVMSKAYAVGAAASKVRASRMRFWIELISERRICKERYSRTRCFRSTFDNAQLEDAVFEDTIIDYIDLQKLCTNQTISAEGSVELGCR